MRLQGLEPWTNRLRVYYHLEKDSEKYIAIKNSNIDSTLRMITGSSESADLTRVDLAAAAGDYLKSIGLSDAECEALRSNLAKDYETGCGGKYGYVSSVCRNIAGSNRSGTFYAGRTVWKRVYGKQRWNRLL